MSFSFKQFHIDDAHCAMKVGTDGVSPMEEMPFQGSWLLSDMNGTCSSL